MVNEDDSRSVEEDGTIRINMGRLYEVSFVKEPLLPEWRVELVQSTATQMFTEYAEETKALEDFYNFTDWKKANDEYFKKIFNRPYNLESARGNPFKKNSVEEVKKELDKLLRTVFKHPEDHKREFKGEWKNEQDS